MPNLKPIMNPSKHNFQKLINHIRLPTKQCKTIPIISVLCYLILMTTTISGQSTSEQNINSATISTTTTTTITASRLPNANDQEEAVLNDRKSEVDTDKHAQRAKIQNHHHHQQQQTRLDEVEYHHQHIATSLHDQQRQHQKRPQHRFGAHTNEISTLGSGSARDKTCALAMKELDRCSSQLIGLGRQSFGSDSSSQNLILYPDSMQDLNSVYCPRFRESVSCIRNQTSCFKPFERQIINWILSSSKKMNYRRCKNENEKIRFLRLTNSCLSTMQDPMDDCMGDYIGSLDAIADYHNPRYNSLDGPERELEFERLQSDGEDVQIQLACCANRRFKQCIMNGAKKMCNDSKASERLKKLRRTNSNSSQRMARKQLLRSMQDTMDDLRTTLDEMTLTGPEFICNNLDEKFCRSKFDNTRFTGSSLRTRHRSIVPAMIKIYANK